MLLARRRSGIARRLGDRTELAELRVAVLDDRLGSELPQLAQVLAQRRAEVLRRQIRIAMRSARRFIHQLIDDAELVGVAGGELERLGGSLPLAGVAVEDRRARLRGD